MDTEGWLYKTDVRIVQECRQRLGSYQLSGSFKTIILYETDMDFVPKGFAVQKERESLQNRKW